MAGVRGGGVTDETLRGVDDVEGNTERNQTFKQCLELTMS